MINIIMATVCVAVVGLLVGVFLGIAGEKFKVEVDERIEAVTQSLPGNNCGGCGYAGCSGLAAAIVEGKAPVNGCPVGGEAVAQKVSEIMGVEAVASVRMTAFVKCAGDCEKAEVNYEVYGEDSCQFKKYLPAGGDKKCTYGCLGGGDCVKACEFDAVHIVNGIAVVDEDKCKACGKCVAACPRNVIELVPADSKVRVACSSKDKGPVAMKACKSACIGCMLCQKNCASQAISVNDALAHVDYDKCVNCNTCVDKCPKGAIKKY